MEQLSVNSDQLSVNSPTGMGRDDQSERKAEFRTQFQPAMMDCGSERIAHADGGKHYEARFVQGRRIVHESRVQHRTATDARYYAKDVLARYRTLVQAALMEFVESQDERQND